MKNIIIVGAGGFGKEVAWIISRINTVNPVFNLVGFCDDDMSKRDDVSCIASFLGSIDDVKSNQVGSGYICAIGNNKIRKKLMVSLNQSGLTPLSVIDPSAVVAEDAVVGAGSFINVHAAVSTGCKLGCGSIVNINASVGHDVVLGDFAQVCPGVSVSGGCVIGEGALLGSNSCCLPCRKMGAWSVLGAGGVLLTDLEEGGSRVRIR